MTYDTAQTDHRVLRKRWRTTPSSYGLLFRRPPQPLRERPALEPSLLTRPTAAGPPDRSAAFKASAWIVTISIAIGHYSGHLKITSIRRKPPKSTHLKGHRMRQNLTLSGRYRLDALLGRGGMGEVWRASDLRLGRSVAVKLLPLDRVDDPRSMRRFEREATAAATLRHRGITVVFDSGADDESRLVFIVMELLDGEDLQHLLARTPGGLPPEQVREFGAQIASVLYEVHRHDVVHRDIKPANLMLTPGEQALKCAAAPVIFAPVANAWGRKGAKRLLLGGCGRQRPRGRSRHGPCACRRKKQAALALAARHQFAQRCAQAAGREAMRRAFV